MTSAAEFAASGDSSGDAVMPIAIVGIAGRFPRDAVNPQKLWDMISAGRSALCEVPEDRFNVDAFYHPHNERQGTMNVRKAHFMNGDVSAFDAPFFSMPVAEAKAMDPQQRMALECTYEALENGEYERFLGFGPKRPLSERLFAETVQLASQWRRWTDPILPALWDASHGTTATCWHVIARIYHSIMAQAPAPPLCRTASRGSSTSRVQVSASTLHAHPPCQHCTSAVRASAQEKLPWYACRQCFSYMST